MKKYIVSLIIVLLSIVCRAEEAKKETNTNRNPAYSAKSDNEVEVRSYGGSYPHVVRIVDSKNKVVCFAVTNSNNASDIACLPLPQ